MRRFALASSLLLATSTTADAQGGFPQDLLGVEFGGDAFTLHSRTGTGVPLGASGRSGHNGMARLGSRLYATEQVGTGASAQFFLDWIDDEDGAATRTVSLARDLRALAPGGGSFLLAVAENGTSDQLVRVNTLNGAITVIGSIGFASVQGLTLAGNTFFGWDINHGLIRIDHVTGVGVDVNPAVGTNGASIQFLATMSDGRVLGGHSSLYEIDLLTGAPALRGSGPYNDLRGAEERFGVLYDFGVGCDGLAMTISGSPNPGGTVQTVSSGHGRFARVFVMIGFSERNFEGLPLPLRLDTFLGTTDCFLYAGPEVTLSGVSGTGGIFSQPLPIPVLTEGLIFHVQHMAFHSRHPGGLAFTNGGTVRVDL